MLHNPIIKLITLDLDGTLLDNHGRITEGSCRALKEAAAAGVLIAIATGRPFSQLPFSQIKELDLPIEYAITTNGASAYHIPDRSLLFETNMPDESAFAIIREGLKYRIHMTAFISGEGYFPKKCLPYIPNLIIPQNVREDYAKTRIAVDDLESYILEHGMHVQKITMNFQRDENGVLLDRDSIEKWLLAREDLSIVSGGFMNLESTKKGIDKGVGLYALADYLGIGRDQTMSIGDAGNDLAIIRAAAVGVCMANGDEDCLAAADYITAANDQEGIAQAVRKFVPQSAAFRGDA